MAKSRLCSIPGCDKPHKARGFCDMHWIRWRTHGDPQTVKHIKGECRRFFDEVVLNYDGDECLIWPFSRDTAGYGQFGIAGKTTKVHRYLCRIVYGPPPTRRHEAAHSCGNGHLGCCAKRHLRWATPVENQADKRSHGTIGFKLTSEKVSAIRLRCQSAQQKTVAAEFGVSPALVCLIVNRKVWDWLD